MKPARSGSLFLFEELPPSKHAVTRRFNVLNCKTKEVLGCIEWSKGWKRYCYFPEEGAILDSKLMGELIKFLQKLMTDRDIFLDR